MDLRTILYFRISSTQDTIFFPFVCSSLLASKPVLICTCFWETKIVCAVFIWCHRFQGSVLFKTEKGLALEDERSSVFRQEESRKRKFRFLRFWIARLEKLVQRNRAELSEERHRSIFCFLLDFYIVYNNFSGFWLTTSVSSAVWTTNKSKGLESLNRKPVVRAPYNIKWNLKTESWLLFKECLNFLLQCSFIF